MRSIDHGPGRSIEISRFFSTVRLANTRRISGTKPTPEPAILYGGQSVVTYKKEGEACRGDYRYGTLSLMGTAAVRPGA